MAKQMLAVIALVIISAYLANDGKEKYLWVTVIPMIVVMTHQQNRRGGAARREDRHASCSGPP